MFIKRCVYHSLRLSVIFIENHFSTKFGHCFGFPELGIGRYIQQFFKLAVLAIALEDQNYRIMLEIVSSKA